MEKLATWPPPNWMRRAAGRVWLCTREPRGSHTEILSSGLPGKVGRPGTAGPTPHWRTQLEQSLRCPRWTAVAAHFLTGDPPWLAARISPALTDICSRPLLPGGDAGMTKVSPRPARVDRTAGISGRKEAHGRAAFFPGSSGRLEEGGLRREQDSRVPLPEVGEPDSRFSGSPGNGTWGFGTKGGRASPSSRTASRSTAQAGNHLAAASSREGVARVGWFRPMGG